MTQRSAAVILAALALAACTHTGVVTETPDLKDMKLASTGEKIGAPVDVRYAIQGPVAQRQATTVALAMVPRVAGKMRVEFASTDDVAIVADKTPLVTEKAAAASAYRYSVKATPLKANTGTLQVIVSMDIEGRSYFSVFNIPLAAATE